MSDGETKIFECQLPEDYEWHPLQIAGHHHENVKDGVLQIGILKDKTNGRLLKLVQNGVLGSSELGLYNTVFVLCQPLAEDRPSVADDPILTALAALIPVFYGTKIVNLGSYAHMFMELEDITGKFRRPCVTDIKMGVQTHDPTASQQKIAIEKRKYPPAAEIGFRFLGMKIFDTRTYKIISKDKMWGRSLKVGNDILTALEGYLVGRHPKYQLKVIEAFIERLKAIGTWFGQQKRFHFYASSLLLVYEGDEICAGKPGHPLVDVRLIDFTHVFDAKTRDSNYLVGLDNLLRYFEELRKKLSKEQN